MNACCRLTLDALPSSVRSTSTFWSSVDRPTTVSLRVIWNTAVLPWSTPRACLDVASLAVAACADASSFLILRRDAASAARLRLRAAGSTWSIAGRGSMPSTAVSASAKEGGASGIWPARAAVSTDPSSPPSSDGDRRLRLLAEGDRSAVGVDGPAPASTGPSTPPRPERSAATWAVHADLKSPTVETGTTVGFASRMWRAIRFAAGPATFGS